MALADRTRPLLPLLKIITAWQYKERAKHLDTLIQHMGHVTEARFVIEIAILTIWMIDREMRPYLQFSPPNDMAFQDEIKVVSVSCYVFTLGMMHSEICIGDLKLPQKLREHVENRIMQFLHLEPDGAYFPQLLMLRHVNIMKQRLEEAVRDLAKEERNAKAKTISALFFDILFLLAATGMLSTCGDLLKDKRREDSLLIWLGEFVFLTNLSDSSLGENLSLHGGKTGKLLLKQCELFLRIQPTAMHYSTSFEALHEYFDERNVPPEQSEEGLGASFMR